MGKTLWDMNKSYDLGKYYNVEVAMTLKEGATCPSNPFQHASELIKKFKDCQEEHVMLQVDGGHDHNCTSPRSIVSFLMTMLELKFQHSIAMKNARGYSIYNPIERAMGAVTFGSQCLALERLEASRELEKKYKTRAS